MTYFGYLPNDFINGEGVSVSLWTAGCPHKCPGCHNSHMWDYDSGYKIPKDLDTQILNALSANGIQRNFSVLGGEPLCPENIKYVLKIIHKVRETYPNIKIFVWTGYTIGELAELYVGKSYIADLIRDIDYLIDGPYMEEYKDLTLHLRGSSNQCIRRYR